MMFISIFLLRFIIFSSFTTIPVVNCHEEKYQPMHNLRQEIMSIDQLERKIYPKYNPADDYVSTGTSNDDGTSSKYGSKGHSSNSYGSYGSSSYGSYNSYGSSPYGKSSSSEWGSSSSGYEVNINVPLGWVIIICIASVSTGMLLTAHQFEQNPEGYYPNFCRLSLHTLDCFWKCMYNLYHCRLGQLPFITAELDEQDEYTEQELESMKLRPGMERALEVEHKKAINRNAQLVQSIKKKIGPVRKGPGMIGVANKNKAKTKDAPPVIV